MPQNESKIRESKSESVSCSVVLDSFVAPWTVHGILQAVILEWVVIPFSRVSSQSRDWTQVSCTAGGMKWSEKDRGTMLWTSIFMDGAQPTFKVIFSRAHCISTNWNGGNLFPIHRERNDITAYILVLIILDIYLCIILSCTLLQVF